MIISDSESLESARQEAGAAAASAAPRKLTREERDALSAKAAAMR
jgi:hypothetical protein